MRAQYLAHMTDTLIGLNLRIPQQDSSPFATDPSPFDYEVRSMGKDWPMYGYSMVGRYRLYNIHFLLLKLEKNDIKRDFIEAVVWR